MTNIDKVRKLLDEQWGTPREIAERVGCHASQVYHEIQRRRENDKPTTITGAPLKGGKTLPVASMEVRLPKVDDQMEIKVRIGSGTGDLRGTVFVSGLGIRYRRPNQKLDADRCLSWAVLDKLMQLGLIGGE